MTSHFFSSRFFNLCGASQLLFLPHAPFDSLLSLFFSISHSLRGTSASFFLSMPRPKLFFLFSSQFFALCGAPQLLFSLYAPSDALVFRL